MLLIKNVVVVLGLLMCLVDSFYQIERYLNQKPGIRTLFGKHTISSDYIFYQIVIFNVKTCQFVLSDIEGDYITYLRIYKIY